MKKNWPPKNWAVWERYGPDLMWPYWENIGGDDRYMIKYDVPIEEVEYDRGMRQLEADQKEYEELLNRTLGWFCGNCGLHNFGKFGYDDPGVCEACNLCLCCEY